MSAKQAAGDATKATNVPSIEQFGAGKAGNGQPVPPAAKARGVKSERHAKQDQHDQALAHEQASANDQAPSGSGETAADPNSMVLAQALPAESDAPDAAAGTHVPDAGADTSGRDIAAGTSSGSALPFEPVDTATSTTAVAAAAHRQG